VHAFLFVPGMHVEQLDSELFVAGFKVRDSSRIYQSGHCGFKLTPLVACVFSGAVCDMGIAIADLGLYSGASSAEPKSLGVSGIGKLKLRSSGMGLNAD